MIALAPVFLIVTAHVFPGLPVLIEYIFTAAGLIMLAALLFLAAWLVEEPCMRLLVTGSEAPGPRTRPRAGGARRFQPR
jgi:hypothetical protein